MKKQANNWDQKLWPPKLNNPTYLSTVSLQRCVSFISKYLHDLYFFIPHVSIFSSFLVSFFQMNHLKACWACETISAHLWKNKPHFHIASAAFFSSYCSEFLSFWFSSVYSYHFNHLRQRGYTLYAFWENFPFL